MAGDVAEMSSMVRLKKSKGDDDNNALCLSNRLQRQWNQLFYSRFLPLSSPSSSSSTSSSLLAPLPFSRRYRSTLGTWISSSSPTASLQLLTTSLSDALLSLSFHGSVLEEHYVSKLVFSWPKVSCIPGYPVRGCRTVFASYKDSAGDIQKFALRFSTILEAETFINALRNVLIDPILTEPPTSDFQSNISSQSAFTSENILPSRALVEDSSTLTPNTCYSPQVPLGLNFEVEQGSIIGQRPEHNKITNPAMPPSFTSLLANLFSEVKQDVPEPSNSKDLDLKSQIARYMEDSSFQEMLSKVEKAIFEIGDGMQL